MLNRIKSKVFDMFLSDEGCRFYEEVLSSMKTLGMDNAVGKGALIGFSGGADSVMLLCLLSYMREMAEDSFNLLAVHVNHMIRGSEADRDAEFSQAFAEALGVEFVCVSRDVPSFATENSLGVEEAARFERYSVFEEIIKGRNDISSVALAHNSTDNLETVIYNMLRGSGISGMCGIPPMRDNIIRPLYTVSASYIRDLLDRFEIPYVLDSTNLSDDYTRNYIRHNVFPTLCKLNNEPERAVLRMTKNLRQASGFINESRDRVLSLLDSFDRFESHHLRGLHPTVFAAVFSEIVHSVTGSAPTEPQIDAALLMIERNEFSLSLVGEYDLVCQRGFCFFKRKNDERKALDTVFYLKKGKNIIEGYNLDIFVGDAVDVSSLNIYNFSIQVDLSRDIIENGLYLRFKRDGDAYRYGGMTRKLKKIFNDKDIPPYMRDRIPLICDSDGIVYLPGLKPRDGSTCSCGEAVRLTLCIRPVAKDEEEIYFVPSARSKDKQKGLENT